jgi:hypothetical protein
MFSFFFSLPYFHDDFPLRQVFGRSCQHVQGNGFNCPKQQRNCRCHHSISSRSLRYEFDTISVGLTVIISGFLPGVAVKKNGALNAGLRNCFAIDIPPLLSCPQSTRILLYDGSTNTYVLFGRQFRSIQLGFL